MSLQAYIFRRKCAKSDAQRDKGLIVPEDVVPFYNISYGSDKKWQIMDIYRPGNTENKLPVIVNFHGGGWVYGTKETYRYYCMELARQGFAVVNPSYRLAPEHRFPAAFEDINSVFSFVLDHAEEYGFDTERIFGIGDSAGATGMAVYACMLTNPEFAGSFPVKAPAGLKLRGVGLNCGLYSMQGKRHDSLLGNFLPKGKEEETLRLLNVPDHVTAQFPPCYLLSALGDFFSDQPKNLIPALEKNGVNYRCKIYGDEQNRLGHVFQCDIRNASAKTANQEQLDFFRSLI